MKNENKNAARNGLLRYVLLPDNKVTPRSTTRWKVREIIQTRSLFFVCFSPLTLSLVSPFSFLFFSSPFLSSVSYSLDTTLAHLSRPYPIAVAACSLMEPYLASLCREDSVRSLVCGLPSPICAPSTSKLAARSKLRHRRTNQTASLASSIAAIYG